MGSSPSTKPANATRLTPLWPHPFADVFASAPTKAERRLHLTFVNHGIASSAEALSELEATGRKLATVGSPFICDVLSVRRIRDARVAIASEYDGGTSVAKLLAEGPIAPARVIAILRQICHALDAAHRCGVTHGGLTTAGIILGTRDGRDDAVSVSDFGLANQLSVPTLGARNASRQPLTPELLSGDVDLEPTRDLYLVGLIGHAMLAGKYAFTGGPGAVREGHRAGKPPKIDAPAPLTDVIKQCLRKDPALRYADASELDWALSRAQDDLGLSTPWDSLEALNHIAALPPRAGRPASEPATRASAKAVIPSGPYDIVPEATATKGFPSERSDAIAARIAGTAPKPPVVAPAPPKRSGSTAPSEPAKPAAPTAVAKRPSAPLLPHEKPLRGPIRTAPERFSKPAATVVAPAKPTPSIAAKPATAAAATGAAKSATVVASPAAKEAATVVGEPPASKSATVVASPAAEKPATGGAKPPASKSATVVASPAAEKPAAAVATPPPPKSATVVAGAAAEKPATAVAESSAQQPSSEGAEVVAEPDEADLRVAASLAAPTAAAEQGSKPIQPDALEPAEPERSRVPLYAAAVVAALLLMGVVAFSGGSEPEPQPDAKPLQAQLEKPGERAPQAHPANSAAVPPQSAEDDGELPDTASLPDEALLPDEILVDDTADTTPATRHNGTGRSRRPGSREGAAPSSGALTKKQRSANSAQEGKRALAQGRTSEAGDHFRKAIALNKRNHQAAWQLGRIEFNRGDYAQASIQFRKAVKVAPRKGGYRIWLGDAYFRANEYGKANKQYKKAKSLGHSRADDRLGRIAGK